MAVLSTKVIGDGENSFRKIVADQVGDVDATACYSGDELTDLKGNHYDLVMVGTVKSWKGSTDNALTVSVVDGPTLVAAAAASAIPPANVITLPPNFFKVGTVLRIKFAGRISSPNPTPGTARFDVRVGAVVAFDSLAILLDPVAARVTTGFFGELMLTCRSIGAGAAATLFGMGWWASQDLTGVTAVNPKGGPVAVLPWNSAPAVGTGFDSTIANTLDFFFTQTVGTGEEILHEYSVEVVNQ